LTDCNVCWAYSQYKFKIQKKAEKQSCFSALKIYYCELNNAYSIKTIIFFEKNYVFIILKLKNWVKAFLRNPIYFKYKNLLLVTYFFEFDISHIFCCSCTITVVACSEVGCATFLSTGILLCLIDILRCCLPCIIHGF